MPIINKICLYFFQKLLKFQNTGSNPEFLSTHPDPENRVADINAMASELECSTIAIRESGFTYEDLKNSLP